MNKKSYRHLFRRDAIDHKYFIHIVSYILSQITAAVLTLSLWTCSCSSLPVYKKKDLEKKFITLEGRKKHRLYLFDRTSSDSRRAVILSDPYFLSEESLYLQDSYSYGMSWKDSYKLSGIAGKLIPKNSYENGNLIPYLNKKGYNVFLIEYDKETELTDPERMKIFGSSVSEVQKTGASEIFLGGLSLGGNTVLDYLSSDPPESIKGVFFLGTGFDYSYTGSFAKKVSEYRKASEICKETDGHLSCIPPVSKIYIRNGKIVSLPKKIPEYPFRIRKNEPGKISVPLFAVFGKIDGISPEETVYPCFYPEKRSKESKAEFLEASTANDLSMDYDHFDLFFSEKAESEIYKRIADWMDALK